MTKLSKVCPQCRAVLKTKSDRTKFCSSYCRTTYFNKRRIFEGQNYVPVKKEEQGADF
jgi:endogenous inhibitor of DNA gyrase (YacG/DUF329 family)